LFTTTFRVVQLLFLKAFAIIITTFLKNKPQLELRIQLLLQEQKIYFVGILEKRETRKHYFEVPTSVTENVAEKLFSPECFLGLSL
jgi:hypothetical protein